MTKIISGRVKKTPQSGITSDRYEFLGLEQAEPDLGDPLVGPSSIGVNPHPPGVQYVLANVNGNGKRYWIRSSELVPPGLSPGSFTVFNDSVQVGIANSFNVFNFVGTGVTIDYVGPEFDDQTGIATVRIQVVDFPAPGDPYELIYHDPNTGFVSAATSVVFRNNNIGIGSTIPTKKLDVLGDINVSNAVYSDDIYSGNLNVGTSSTTIKTSNSNVGIGTTLPTYKLDVFGSSRFYGFIHDYQGGIGEPGDVLISNGTEGFPVWGTVGEDAPVGRAVSLTTREAENNQLYYIGFSSTTDSYSSTYVDSDGLYYNPASVRLGLGTEPQYSLDVLGTIRANQIIANNIKESPGIVTTTSTDTAIIDTFNTSEYRSVRYNLQVTTNNQLQLGTSSLSNINPGFDYTNGIYNDVDLVSSGIGTGAKATITVVAPDYPISSSFGGIFTTTTNISGLQTGLSVISNTTLPPSDYEQSKLTSIQVLNSGSGYTTTPNIIIDSPVISGNPVAGVGVGSTAIVTNVFMKVTNTILNTPGISTNVVPSVTYSTPIGGGVTATGYVGFGISTFTITNPGSGYTSSPTIVYDKVPTSLPTTRVGLGISDAGILITGGTGYGSGTVITVDPPPLGGVTATIALGSIDGSGRITDIDITNVGSGYTVPPNITITDDDTGVGAAITITQMIVTNVFVDDVGSGFGTSKPGIAFTGGGGTNAAAVVDKITLTSIEVTNSGYGYTSSDMPVTAVIPTPGVGSTVGLGIDAVVATTGLGYTINPSFNIDSPSISPQIGAALTSSIGYDETFNLFSGPGYGGTSIYYIDPIDSNSFRVTKTPLGSDYVTLGFDVSSNPDFYIGGGSVTDVSITNSGSGYEIGETLTIGQNALNSEFDILVGAGFSFTVSGTLIQSFQVSDVMLLQSVGSASTDAYVVEYAGISNLEDLGEYSADINGQNVRLKFTPTYAHNTIKLTRERTEL